MTKQRRHRTSFLANLSLRTKMLGTCLLMVLMLGFIILLTIRIVYTTQHEKYRQMEQTALAATDQMVAISVESALSIAQNIYTNDAIYTFLNKKYASSSAYYEAYYPLQQNTAMNIADTNIVSRCTIYTDNPTVLSGGSIQKLSSAKDAYWYQCFIDMNKSTILCIDPEDDSMYIVRRMDYQTLETGESVLCLRINSAALEQYIQQLGFEGELYLISGGNLVFSNDTTDTSVQDIQINSDFACITRNYYTFELEYYASASEKSLMDFLGGNLPLFGMLLGILVLMCIFLLMQYRNVRKRLKNAIREYRANRTFAAFHKGEQGSDEIGTIIDICTELSERLMRQDDQFDANNSNLVQKSTAYNELFTTAMRLDAELHVRTQLAEICLPGETSEQFTAATELGLVRRVAKHCGAAAIGGNPEIPVHWKVPAYALALITEDVLTRLGAASVEMRADEEALYLTYSAAKPLRSTDSLRLQAVFEEDEVTDAYDFARAAYLNPYLRLKHCLGSRADLQVLDKGNFQLTLRISFPTEEIQPEQSDNAAKGDAT